MGDLFGTEPGAPYADRIALLLERHIGLWDICRSARRCGSLDKAIDDATIAVNDFPSFFRGHRKIRLICCNGRKAGQLYQSRVLPALTDEDKRIPFTVLPSTSSAFAAMPYEEKLRQWSVVRIECRAEQ